MTTRRALVEAARGDRPLDLVVRGGSIVNVYTEEIYPADVGIFGDRIAVVDRGGAYGLEAAETIDARGLTLIPGLVDTHLHIESTMVTPPNYARAVVPLGTTTCVIDPHEIGNVLGKAGVDYMLRASEGLPLRIYVTVPSCVPAVMGIETAGAVLRAEDVAEMLGWPRVVGVAELMDYPGIVKQNEHIAAIVEAGLAAGQALEGHSPLLDGRGLNAYLAAGVDSDHESREWREMVDKLRLGMWIYGRENTFRHGIGDLVRALQEVPDAWNVAMCTDDIDPADLLAQGHLDRGVRGLIAGGIQPARAIRYATLNGAQRYGLHDHGAIAPGKLADLAIVERIEELRPRIVLSGGKVVARDGKTVVSIVDPVPPPLENSVRVGALDTSSFELRHPGPDGDVRVRTIEIDRNRTTTLGEATVRFVGGVPALPLPDGMVLLSVVPRHGQRHRPTVALLRGLGLAEGGIASTIAHDSHNLIVAGRTPADMLLAARAVVEMGGGASLVAGGAVVARVRLPVAGLMSAEPVEVIAEEVGAFNALGREMGLWAGSPVLAISSLALPVSPHIRITDLGVIEVESQQFVELFA
jgi:adenine deaminase